MSSGTWVLVFGLIFLLFCSALISGSETAFFSIRPSDVDELESEDEPSSKRLLILREKPRTLLATILIANNFINILIVILSEVLVSKILPSSLLEFWGASISEVFPFAIDWPFFINFLITVIGVTFLLVLLGEVTPKVYAQLNYMTYSRRVSSLLIWLNRILAPISGSLVSSAHQLETRLAKVAARQNEISYEEMDEAIDLATQDEDTSIEEIGMLKSIIKFGEVTVNEVMKPSVDITAIDITSTFEEVMKIVRDSGYSRIPVFEESLDNVKGILYIKDLIEYYHEPKIPDWQRLIRDQVMYVPSTKKIHELLKEFQAERLHMGIVVDEYGATEGLVTLEDIMEEVVGEIQDEFDAEEDEYYQKLDAHNYIFEGKTLLNDFCRVVDLDTSYFDEVKGDADSVAGLILEATGDFPPIGTTLTIKGIQFKVLQLIKRRLEKVQIMFPEGFHVNP